MNTRVVTAYFSGTDFSINAENVDQRSLASFLYHYTDTRDGDSFGFHGCGVKDAVRGSFSRSGILFGSGLDEQCQAIVMRIRELIAQGHDVILNSYGYERGGMAALFLAKMLKKISPQHLHINLVLNNPTPGNLKTTVYGDVFGITLASQGLDLSDCYNLARVLTLYSHAERADVGRHFLTPIRPTYPKQCSVEEVVIPGESEQAEKMVGSVDVKKTTTFEIENYSSFVLATRFLERCGTHFKPFGEIELFDRSEFRYLKVPPEDFIPKLIDVFNQCVAAKLALSNQQSRTLLAEREVRLVRNANGTYFNELHKELMHPDQARVTTEDLMFEIKSTTGFIASINATMKNHPYLWGAIKWLTLGAAGASALVLTGGFVAIPLLGSWLTLLGATYGVAAMIAAITPVVALAATTVWYGLIKPIGNLFLETFCLVKQNDDFANPIIQANYPDPKIGIFGRIKNTINNHPIIFSGLAWLVAGAAVATAAFFTLGISLPLALLGASIVTVLAATVKKGFLDPLFSIPAEVCCTPEPSSIRVGSSTADILRANRPYPGVANLAAGNGYLVDENEDDVYVREPLINAPARAGREDPITDEVIGSGMGYQKIQNNRW